MDGNFVAPSGRVLSIGTGDDCPIIGVNTSCNLANGLTSRLYQVGLRGYHEMLCRHLEEPAKLAWRDVIQGQELMVSWDGAFATIASVRGPWHDILGIFSGPPPSKDLVRSMFLDVNFEDSPDGVTIEPGPGLMMDMAWEHVDLVFQDRGHVNVPGADTASGLVPDWAGTSSRFGEIWRETTSVEGKAVTSLYNSRMIIGQATAAAEVSFNSAREVDESTLWNWLNHLQISWN